MATPNIVPRADSEGGIGTATKYWASAYIDLIYLGAGKIGRDAHNLIDFSTDNTIQFRASDGVRLFLNDVRLAPHTSNELALGAADRMWSDLFLASGAVINFDNGNVILTHSNNKLILADSDQLGFGTDADLVIYHDTQDTYISNDNGHLYIQNIANDKDVIFRSDDGSGGVATYLTLDGSATNMKAGTDMIFADGKAAMFGDGGDAFFKHDGSNFSFINDVGNVTFTNRTDDGDIIFQSDDGSGGTTAYLTLDGSNPTVVFSKSAIFTDNIAAYFGSGLDFNIVHNGTDSQVTNANGNLQFTNTANDKDISFASDNGAGGDAIYFYLDGSSAAHDGSATTGLYTNWPTNSFITLGTSHDFQINHNGSSSSINNFTGNLFITQQANDSDLILRCDDEIGRAHV